MNREAIPPRRATTSLTRLLARYLSGDIAEQAWRRISAVLDAEGTTPEERLAFADRVNAWLDRRAPTPQPVALRTGRTAANPSA